MVCVSDFCVDDSLIIILGAIIDIVLVCVLIAQSRILSAQATHYRRTSQVSLMEEKISDIKISSIKLINEKRVDANLFDDLTMKLYNIHYLFKEKVLKPVDFAIEFSKLFYVIQFNEFYKTNTYNKNYLRLQIIFDDFNRDVDAIVRTIYNSSLESTEQIDDLKINKIMKRLLKNNFHDWASVLNGTKLGVWTAVRICRRKRFKLIPPLEL